MLLGDGGIQQRFLNKVQQDTTYNRSTSMRNSMSGPFQMEDSPAYSAEPESQEEEEEEEEKYHLQGRLETAQGQLYDFEHNINQNIDHEMTSTYDEKNKVKALDSVTLLVIQETLLEDFLITDKKEQERKLNNIGDVNIHQDSSEVEEGKAEEEFEEEKKEGSQTQTQEEQSSGTPEERAAKNSLKSVKFDLLMKQILLPFFQIQTRILQKGNVFEIGTIKFLVAATTPHKQGKVTTKTKIR